MEREDLFDVDVEPVICEYISGSEALPNAKYVECVTYDALLRNYYRVKKSYIDAKKIIKEQKKYMEDEISKKFPNGIKAGEYPKHEYCECVTEPIEKPPLGVKPYFIQAEERIKDLADAISRYVNRGDYEIIKRWANEILMQCDIAEMEKDEE